MNQTSIKEIVKYAIIVIALINISACENALDCHNDINCMITNNRKIKVDACDTSGERRRNAKVDIGYDSYNIKRNYYGYTNNNRQLVYVEAQNLILQTKQEEHHGNRLCNGQADVKGTELKNYDKGHVIADALGGVSNAYNITPEHSYVNRKGVQYQLERYLINQLQNNHQVTNVKVIISYPDDKTQIPNKYDFSWELDGKQQQVSFENK